MAREQTAIESALARADAWGANPSVRPLPKISREVCVVLANEVRRLQDLRPIAGRVAPEVYSQAFSLCKDRDCSVSELVGLLLTEALANGEANKLVEKVESNNAMERVKLTKSELK